MNYRTNCVDNLDRTNVVQTLIAERVTRAMMGKDNTFHTPFIKKSEAKRLPKLFPFSSLLESLFKRMWIENANTLSLLYSGTPALKTELVHAGKRTIRGLVKDGSRSVKRYFVNNFYDGVKQDAFTFFIDPPMVPVFTLNGGKPKKNSIKIISPKGRVAPCNEMEVHTDATMKESSNSADVSHAIDTKISSLDYAEHVCRILYRAGRLKRGTHLLFGLVIAMLINVWPGFVRKRIPGASWLVTKPRLIVPILSKPNFDVLEHLAIGRLENR